MSLNRREMLRLSAAGGAGLILSSAATSQVLPGLIVPNSTATPATVPAQPVAAPAAPIALRSGRPAYAPPESFWQKEEPKRSRPMRWVGGLAVSLVAAMVLFALTLALDYFYFDRRTEPGRAFTVRTSQCHVSGVWQLRRSGLLRVIVAT